MANPEPLIVPDGSEFEDASTGDWIVLAGDGISLDLDSIRNVGIDNLCDVETHCINRVYDTISHFIRFTGGGEVRFVISLTGELLELYGQGVNMHISKGGILYFGPYRLLSPRHESQ